MQVIAIIPNGKEGIWKQKNIKPNVPEQAHIGNLAAQNSKEIGTTQQKMYRFMKYIFIWINNLSATLATVNRRLTFQKDRRKKILGHLYFKSGLKHGSGNPT